MTKNDRYIVRLRCSPVLLGAAIGFLAGLGCMAAAILAWEALLW